jgi:transposase
MAAPAPQWGRDWPDAAGSSTRRSSSSLSIHTPVTPPPIRTALPDAQITMDHFRLIMLVNRAVTAVRQRVT